MDDRMNSVFANPNVADYGITRSGARTVKPSHQYRTSATPSFSFLTPNASMLPNPQNNVGKGNQFSQGSYYESNVEQGTSNTPGSYVRGSSRRRGGRGRGSPFYAGTTLDHGSTSTIDSPGFKSNGPQSLGFHRGRGVPFSNRSARGFANRSRDFRTTQPPVSSASSSTLINHDIDTMQNYDNYLAPITSIAQSEIEFNRHSSGNQHHMYTEPSYSPQSFALKQDVVFDDVSTATFDSRNRKEADAPVIISLNSSVETTKSDRDERFSVKTGSSNRFIEMKANRDALQKRYIKENKMADPDMQYPLDSAPKFVAECKDMCPEYERHEREYERGLDRLERMTSTTPGDYRVDHSKAVKRFHRSAAGMAVPLPCDVRPPSVLLKTLDYLFDEILGKYGIEDSYSFVRDRARAIRTDLTIQNYRGKEAIELHERIARYHIMCSHAFCDSTSVSLQQEHEQMRKTLQSLMEYYKEMAVKGVRMPNEPEFQAYYILTHAWSNEHVSKCESELPEHVFLDDRVQLALHLRFLMARTNEEYIMGRPSVAGSLNNYAALFLAIQNSNVPYLFACCLQMEFADIRRGALKAMQRSYHCVLKAKRRWFPVQDLLRILGFEDEDEVVETLQYYGIQVDEDNGQQLACIGRMPIVTDRGKRSMEFGVFIENPNTAKLKERGRLTPRKSIRLVESKRFGLTDVDIVNGKGNYIAKPSLLPSISQPFSCATSNSNHQNVPLLNKPTSKLTFDDNRFSNQHASTFATPHTTEPYAFTFGHLQSSNFSNNIIPAAQPFPQHLTLKLPLDNAPLLNTTANSLMFGHPTQDAGPALFPFPPPIQQTQHYIAPATVPTSYFSESAMPTTNFTFSQFQQAPYLKSSTPVGNVQTVLQPPKQDFANPILPTINTAQSTLSDNRLSSNRKRTASIKSSPVFTCLKAPSTIKHVDKYGDSIAQDISRDLIEELVQEYTKECVSSQRDLLLFKNAVSSISDELLDQLIFNGIEEIVMQLIDEKQWIQQMEAFGWFRWRFICHQRRIRRKAMMKLTLHLRSNLSASSLAPSFRPQFGVSQSPMLRLSTDYNDKQFGERLVKLAAAADLERSKWQEPMDWTECIFPTIRRRNDLGSFRKIFLKFVVSLPTAQLDMRDRMSPLTMTWLACKLVGSQPTSVEKSWTKVFEIGPNGPRVYLCVNNFCYVGETGLTEQKHNSEATISGVNAIIFQLDELNDHCAIDMYWKLQISRFQELMSNMPRACHCPLLIAYWDTNRLPAHYIQSQVYATLGLDIYLEENTISSFSFFGLEASFGHFDNSLACAKLESAITMLVERLHFQPDLCMNPLQEFISPKLSLYLQSAANHIESALLPYTKKYPETLCTALNIFVEVYNLFLTTLCDIIAAEEMLNISFPAVEFQETCELPLTWNSPATLKQYLRLAHQSRLLEAHHLAKNEHFDYINACNYFLEYFKHIPAIETHACIQDNAARIYQHISDTVHESFSLDSSLPLAQILLQFATAAFSPFVAVLESKMVPYLPVNAHKNVEEFVFKSKQLMHSRIESMDLSRLFALDSLVPVKTISHPLEPVLSTAVSSESTLSTMPLANADLDASTTPYHGTRKRVDSTSPTSPARKLFKNDISDSQTPNMTQSRAAALELERVMEAAKLILMAPQSP
ncbi:actin cytoskeleton and mitosis protein [Batrachochytrium dendrobatidis]|nr:actin cytoskeleton and mitosis protein [Batrachochytrium dendrobatidis]KAK5668720.1 actin cytoskeleton and mitosis protein [Batrachochytrium dendrobatidis]